MAPPRLPPSVEFRVLRRACGLSPRAQRLLFGAPPTIEGQSLACDLHVLLELTRRLGIRSFTNLLPPPQARAFSRRNAAATMPRQPLPAVRAEEVTIPTAAG